MTFACKKDPTTAEVTMKRTMICVLLLVLWITSSLPRAQSATILVGPGNPLYTDCSAATVQSAINAARDGDTVTLTCTGTQTWTSTVSIPDTKGITLQAQGGTNTPKASAVFPLTISSSCRSYPADHSGRRTCDREDYRVQIHEYYFLDEGGHLRTRTGSWKGIERKYRGVQN